MEETIYTIMGGCGGGSGVEASAHQFVVGASFGGEANSRTNFFGIFEFVLAKPLIEMVTWFCMSFYKPFISPFNLWSIYATMIARYIKFSHIPQSPPGRHPICGPG